MIHDHHAHVHDPDVIAERDQFAARDAWFAVQNPAGSRRLSSAARLLRAMDTHGVTRADALAFGWRDHGLCVARNDAMMTVRLTLDPVVSAGLRWFGAVNPASGRSAADEIGRLASHGFAGVGELFPDGQGFDVTDRATMAPFLEACVAHGMAVVIHASDPDGPDFDGRDCTDPKRVLALLEIVGDVAPSLPLVLAHLGGGLPLLANDLDVRRTIERTDVRFDTAACSYLYSPFTLNEAIRRCPGRIVFGSDHPVCGIDRSLHWVRAAGVDPSRLG